ncbi:hypothetical protein LPN04_31165 [Rugamonas sp. A1-17]|nr:hypothetical protein [Rugamonas sp. A1-17]
MDKNLLELAKSWDELNRALGVLLVAQSSNMTAAAAAVEAARARHARLFVSYTTSQL